MKFDPDALQGRFTRLEPLTDALKAPLHAAIASADPAWNVMASNASGPYFEGWWARACAEMVTGERVAYAVRRLADQRVVGATSFLHIDPANRSVEIGSTFLHAESRAGPTNPDMKLALLSYAFANGAVRVEIRTDGRNLRSQAAIAKLGAVREGVLRKQKVLWNGEARETVVYSIIDDDWPQVQARLQARLDEAAAVRGGAPAARL